MSLSKSNILLSIKKPVVISRENCLIEFPIRATFHEIYSFVTHCKRNKSNFFKKIMFKLNPIYAIYQEKP